MKKKSARSELQEALEFQLNALRIPFEREVEFCKPRKFRADFILTREDGRKLIVEVQGGVWVGGRHSRGGGMESDGEKSALAAIGGYQLMNVTGNHVKKGKAVDWVKTWWNAGRAYPIMHDRWAEV